MEEKDKPQNKTTKILKTIGTIILGIIAWWLLASLTNFIFGGGYKNF